MKCKELPHYFHPSLTLRSLVTIGQQSQVPVIFNPAPTIQPIRNPSARSIWNPFHFFTQSFFVTSVGQSKIQSISQTHRCSRVGVSWVTGGRTGFSLVRSDAQQTPTDDPHPAPPTPKVAASRHGAFEPPGSSRKSLNWRR